jgi:NAD(P)-dependent dehydrogenase (short-subunit alcohol dehydrogenase family)
MDFKNTPVIITGGGSGLGAATARRLAHLGAKISLLDLKLDMAQAIADDIDGLAIQCDVTNENSVKEALASAANAYGGHVLSSIVRAYWEQAVF